MRIRSTVLRAPRRLAVALTAALAVGLVAPGAGAAIVESAPAVDRGVGRADASVTSVTLDWNAGSVTVPISWEHFSVTPVRPAGAEAHYVVGPNSDHTGVFVGAHAALLALTGTPLANYPEIPDPWLAPASFEFDVAESVPGSDADLSTTRVVVTVLNIPARPSVSDIPTPVVDDVPVLDLDLASMWDTGQPIVPSKDNGRAPVLMPQIPVATAGQVHGADNRRRPQVSVRLNPEMARLFTVSSRGGALVVRKRAGAPAPPYSYWTLPWFRVDYEVSGVLQHPATATVERAWSVAKALTFTKPRYAVRARSVRTFNYLPRVPSTAWNYVMPAANAHGAVGGSWRIEVAKLPKSVAKNFRVKVENPRFARSGSTPRLNIGPRTRAGMRATGFRITFRASALDRTGTRIWTPWQTATAKPLR